MNELVGDLVREMYMSGLVSDLVEGICMSDLVVLNLGGD